MAKTMSNRVVGLYKRVYEVEDKVKEMEKKITRWEEMIQKVNEPCPTCTQSPRYSYSMPWGWWFFVLCYGCGRIERYRLRTYNDEKGQIFEGELNERAGTED